KIIAVFVQKWSGFRREEIKPDKPNMTFSVFECSAKKRIKGRNNEAFSLRSVCVKLHEEMRRGLPEVSSVFHWSDKQSRSVPSRPKLTPGRSVCSHPHTQASCAARQEGFRHPRRCLLLSRASPPPSGKRDFIQGPSACAHQARHHPKVEQSATAASGRREEWIAGNGRAGRGAEVPSSGGFSARVLFSEDAVCFTAGRLRVSLTLLRLQRCSGWNVHAVGEGWHS
ncbi:hypothetical protein IRJ41_015517, partial [Triplophysa rosa]